VGGPARNCGRASRYLQRRLPYLPRPARAGIRAEVSATLAGASSGVSISNSARAPGARRGPWSVLGGGEEVNKQLIDALSLVVMDPVRAVGQALDAVEVGHILVLGLG
jgi:hypothetical protein